MFSAFLWSVSLCISVIWPCFKFVDVTSWCPKTGLCGLMRRMSFWCKLMEKEVKEFAGQDGVKKADRCLSFKITSRNISEIVWESSYIGSYHKKSCKVLNTNSEPWRTFCFFSKLRVFSMLQKSLDTWWVWLLWVIKLIASPECSHLKYVCNSRKWYIAVFGLIITRLFGNLHLETFVNSRHKIANSMEVTHLPWFYC